MRDEAYYVARDFILFLRSAEPPPYPTTDTTWDARTEILAAAIRDYGGRRAKEPCADILTAERARWLAAIDGLHHGDACRAALRALE